VRRGVTGAAGRAVLAAPAGVYALRVRLPDGGQRVDIPDVRVAAGESVERAVEAPAAVLTVGWVAQAEHGTGAIPWPRVRIYRGPALVADRAGNPAWFLLLPGDYTVVVLWAGRVERVRRTVSLAAGETRVMEVEP
jgi:hypothetical protein